MVDALSLMSNGLKSGLSVVQALGLVTQEMANPIQQEFSLVLSENKLGVSLEDAFTNLSKRVKSDDVEMFVTSINILKETGGNLGGDLRHHRHHDPRAHQGRGQDRRHDRPGRQPGDHRDVDPARAWRLFLSRRTRSS